MTWNARRKDWMGKPAREAAPVPVPASPPPVLPPGPVLVPAVPMFSPAAIAGLLKVYRSTVQYWLANGKLESFQDNIGERYVLRAELVRFVREYLKRGVQ